MSSSRVLRERDEFSLFFSGYFSKLIQKKNNLVRVGQNLKNGGGCFGFLIGTRFVPFFNVKNYESINCYEGNFLSLACLNHAYKWFQS